MFPWQICSQERVSAFTKYELLNPRKEVQGQMDQRSNSKVRIKVISCYQPGLVWVTMYPEALNRNDATRRSGFFSKNSRKQIHTVQDTSCDNKLEVFGYTTAIKVLYK